MSEARIDWNAVLAIAGGSEAVRERIVEGVLERFGEDGEMAPLLAVPPHPSRTDAERLRALAHRAVGLARQGAMPGLALLCGQLSACLAEERFAAAGALGAALREEREAIRGAVAVLRGQR